MDLALFDFITQIGNARIAIEVNLASVDTVCNGRAISFYAESVASCVKGNGILFVVNLLSFSCRAFVRSSFQNPRVHLICDGLAVVDLVIDLIVQLGFVHAELQSGITHGGVDVVIARNRNRVVGFNYFFVCIRICQRPAFLQFGDVFFVGLNFCFYFVQLFSVHRVGAGFGYVAVFHVGDFITIRINAVFIDVRFIANFKRFTCNAFKSCERFVQAEFVTYFFTIFLVVSNSQISSVDGECRSGHRVDSSVCAFFRAFLNCHIVARFDCGLGGFQLRYIDRVGVFRTCRHMGNLATCNDSVSCLIDFILAYTDGPFGAFPCRFQLFFRRQSVYEIRMLFLPCIKSRFRFGFIFFCRGFVKFFGQIIVFFFRGVNNRCPFIIVFFFIQGRQGIFKRRAASCRNVSDATGLSVCRRLCA